MRLREQLKELHLGMHRKTVSLSPYNTNWSKAFLVAKSLLQQKISLRFDLHHIGSTSIPNIKAKPILDILGVVTSIEEFDSCRFELEDLGFTWKGEYGIANRRFCILYDEKEEFSLIHLHVFAKANNEVEKHLIFRDYLIASPSTATRYEELKISLAQGDTRSNYSEGKSELIAQLLKEAYEWKNRNNLD